MNKCRRIEVNAYRRRVTVVSAEWPRNIAAAPPEEPDDGISLHDADFSEPIAPESAEGQLILAEAVRSLQRRLSPEARATIHADQNCSAPNRSNGKFRSFYKLICPKALRFARKEK
ncbi:MAG: hypothetical protein ACR2H6_12590 [Pyrinomonadaceae bacterium]